MAETFAKMVSSLMNDQANAPQTAQTLAVAGVVDALNNAMSIHPTEPRVQTSCNEAGVVVFHIQITNTI